jgi:ankyrin repeat protein
MEVVKALLARGADVKARSKDGVTALLNAAEVGSAEIVQALLANGTDPDFRSNDGSLRLIQAAAEGYTPSFRHCSPAGQK